MQRFTMTMSDEFADELAAFMQANGYENRSEAMRDLARIGFDQAKTEALPAAQTLATLVYVFDHATREIPKRLAQSYHQHHELSVATMHVHLDHENCLEIAVLRGETAEVRRFSQSIIAERGVRHGRVTFVPVEVYEEEHSHRHAGEAIPHTHVHPKG